MIGMTTLDKIAARMAGAAGKSWSELGENHRNTWRDHAQSVLEPLLYPDETMMEAGCAAATQIDRPDGPKVHVVFTAMMRAMFEEKPDHCVAEKF